jgi:hypothetical protein
MEKATIQDAPKSPTPKPRQNVHLLAVGAGIGHVVVFATLVFAVLRFVR